MNETDRLTDEETKRQKVLLEARSYLEVLLGYRSTMSGDKARGGYLDLIKNNSWLEGEQGDEDTPLTRLRASIIAENSRLS